MRDYLKLVGLSRKYWGILALGVLFSLIASVFDSAKLPAIVPLLDNIFSSHKITFPATVPHFAQKIITKISTLSPLVLLKLVIVYVGISFVINKITLFFKDFFMNIVAQKTVRDVRQRIYEKLHMLSLDFYSQKRMGELMSRITNDTGIIAYAISTGLSDLIYQSFVVMVLFSLAMFISWKITLGVILVFPLIICPVLKIGRRMKKLSTFSQKAMADLNTILSETIAGIRIVKGFSQEEEEINKFRRANHNYYRFMIKGIKRMLLLSPLTETVIYTVAFVMLYLGGKQIIEGKISPGVLALLIASLTSISKPAKRLSQVYGINQTALAASERIYRILEEKPSVKETKTPINLNPLSKEIVFDNVWFRYAPGEEYVLKNINLRVKAGERVAVVGSSGVGKTTLLNLLPRFYDPTKGKILFDGIDIKLATLKSLRQMIGLVTQEMVLFNDTVAANIAYGKKNASRQEIETAAKKAYAYDFIMRLPQGFDTIVGDRGFRLSGGEQQRISIARAVLKNPQILLLDEATSQLDSESEEVVQLALEELMRNKTVFIVAHRLSTVKDASRILVLDKGEITAMGQHEELLSQSPLYSRLYSLQFRET